MPRFASEQLRSLAFNLFVAAGVSHEESAIVAESLVDSNLCGHDSHGVMRVAEYLQSLQRHELRAGVELRIESRTPVVVTCDGQFGFGQVQMRRLMDLLESPVREFGIACGAIRRCGHIGRLGEWAERLALRGLVGLLSVNDNGVFTCVAPPGAVEPVLSTNPIAVGVPTSSDPLVLDISTSMAANGKVKIARLAGQSVPEGWLLDAQGRPTTDPHARLSDPPGTLLPMGGYKGFGLGMLFDILVGGLSGGCCPPPQPGEVECNNVLLVVFDPQRFAGQPHFCQQADGLIQFARGARRQDPATETRLPNDRSRETRQSRLVEGINLDDGTWDELVTWSQRLHVALPS